jgi:Mu-like prophage I protein
VLETAISRLESSPVAVFSEAGAVWLEALPARTYHTSQYGEVAVTKEKLERMVDNFKSNVRGQDVATDFDHGMDRAKGNKASGWYRDFEVRPSSEDPNQFSLWAAVEFTDEAKAELRGKQWKYFSLEWDDAWSDNSGRIHNDVVIGGGLTNRPIAKKTMPINFSEVVPDNIREAYDLLIKEGFTVDGESKEMEHSEPGTGSPPAPRKDEDGSTDPAIEGGWRRDPLPRDPVDPTAPKPNSKEGGDSKLTAEQIAELYKLTGIEPPEEKEGEDTDHSELVAAVTAKFSEQFTPEQKKFAEDYPVQWAEHQKLLANERRREGEAFSESVKTVKRMEGETLVNTTQGLSSLAKEKIAETHKKFAEGTVTPEDFEETIKTITDGGIVTFGENGSNRTDGSEDTLIINTNSAEGIADARKMFAEKITEIQLEGDGMSFDEAFNAASTRYPELAQAYRAPMTA